MSRLLMDSRYYRNWLKHSQLKESAKYAYSRQLMRFEQYLSRDYEGELDFDHFYFDILTNTPSTPIALTVISSSLKRNTMPPKTLCLTTSFI
jgi:hypothetical protein